MTHGPDSEGRTSGKQDPTVIVSLDPWEHEPDTQADSTDDLTGLNAGSYELLEFIGGGAMGRVYRARKRGRQRQRAIKVLRPTDGQAEALIHEAIDHPNVVAVEDFGTLTDRQGRERPYIVMELLSRGAALDYWIAEHKPALDERLRLIEEAARGVAYAHSLGVLHHDLKPANILVDRFGTAKVADFGLAQLRIEAGHTPSGGTRAYQSPEQCSLSATDLDARSDVYALGATLFSTLTDGAVPVPMPAIPTREETRRIKLESDPMLSLLPADTPLALVSLLRKALAAQREDRHESAHAFANAIAQVRAEGRTPVGRGKAVLAGWCRTRPRLVAWVLGMVIGLVLAFAFSFPLRMFRPLENWYLAQLPALDAETVNDFEEVRIVRMPPPFEMVALATELGVKGVQASPARTWRPMHGQFVDAMSQAGARVVAFDLYFPQAWPELDAPFAAAIERSTERGTPVVIGANSWIVDAADRPVMPEAFGQAGARWGSLLLDLAGPLPLIPLVAQPPEGEGLPSFVLATNAAALQPQAQFSAWTTADGVRMRFWQPVGDTGQRRRIGVDVLWPAAIQQSVSRVPKAARRGRGEDWNMAYTQRAVFGIDALDKATLDYAQLLRDPPQERSRKVGQRTLVVLDPTHDSRIDVGLERDVFGGEVLAGAVQVLMANRTFRKIPKLMTLLVCIPIVALGAGVGVSVRTTGHRPGIRWGLRAVRLALLCLVIAAVAAGTLLLYTYFGLMTLPALWLLAVVISCLTASYLSARFAGGRRLSFREASGRGWPYAAGSSPGTTP